MELPKSNKTELIWLPHIPKLNYFIKQHLLSILWQPITIHMLSHHNTATLVTKQTIIRSMHKINPIITKGVLPSGGATLLGFHGTQTNEYVVPPMNQALL